MMRGSSASAELPEFETSTKRFTAVVAAAVGIGKGSGEGKSATICSCLKMQGRQGLGWFQDHYRYRMLLFRWWCGNVLSTLYLRDSDVESLFSCHQDSGEKKTRLGLNTSPRIRRATLL